MPKREGEIIVKRKWLKLLLMQRTNYQSEFGKFCCQSKLKGAYHFLINILEARRLRAISELYQLDLNRDFADFSRYLPKQIETIVDIGSGMGGINIMLKGFCADHTRFYLIDRNKVDRRTSYGFQEQASAYNSFAVAEDFLTENGLSASQLHFVDIDKDPFPENINADLVISLLSWGHHYPVGTYLPQVKKAMSENGLLVMDVRNGTAGLEELRSSFKDVIAIREDFKSTRVIAGPNIQSQVS